MKIKKLEKGFTLVEILVAVALFGMTCAVLFTATLYAVRSNKENHYAGEEIQMQMNTAENYDNKQTLFDNKVSAHRFGGSNKVQLKVDYNKTSSGQTVNHGFSFSNKDVYAYQANAGYKERGAAYNMRFFDPEDATLVNPPDYWFIRFHNYSNGTIDRHVYINPSVGISIYGKDGVDFGTDYSGLDLADDTGAVSYQFGLDMSRYNGSSDSLLFVGYWYNDFYKDPTYSVDPSVEIELKVSNIDEYKEFTLNSETGLSEPTGYIDIYYDGFGIYNKADFEAAHGT